MKKKQIVLLILFILFTIPFLNYYFLGDILIYHPYEINYLDEDENLLLTTLKNKKADYITINEVPQKFISYLLCIEDKTFYNHNGVNFSRLFKAFLNNLVSEDIQGGSTITMQLARLLYLNNKKNLLRKYQEILYAIKIENSFSKEQILEYYLNSIYFAHGIYGLRSASIYYFQKDVNELVIFEMAMLIGIINSPNNYSPYIDLEKSLNKTKIILQTLRNNNLITYEEYYASFNYQLNLINHENDKLYSHINYYLDGVINEIDKKHLLTENDYRTGINITTFLNKELQESIQNIISNMDLSIYNVAICVMETFSNKVISLIGGKDYNISSFNRALYAKKQIGSTIKPFIYYLALLNGFTPLSEFKSEKTTFHINNYGDYEVSNAGEIYANRKITLLEALAMSDNIYAVKTLLSLGTKSLISLLDSFSLEVDVNNITLALGANSLSLLELTSLYNCIASGGKYYAPKFIKEIKKNNKTIYKANAFTYKIKMYKKETEVIRSLLRAPFDKSLETYAKPSLMNYYISPSFGGKTGSTKSSSYVIGFSPQYVIGVYIGSDDNTYLDKGYLSREIFYQIGTLLDEKKLDYFQPSSSLNSFKLYNPVKNLHSFEYYSN